MFIQNESSISATLHKISHIEYGKCLIFRSSVILEHMFDLNIDISVTVEHVILIQAYAACGFVAN